ncbi:hypothetical protein [Paenibacillus sp. FSL P2-0136]|uniref:hypothetical protein n=1 Tax=unclassified Paenibacillus TaxID=185978 RepID=UPI0030DCF4FB
MDKWRAGVWPECMRKTAYIVLTCRRVTPMYAENSIHLLARRRMARMYAENSIHLLARRRMARMYAENSIHLLVRRRMARMYAENSIQFAGTQVISFTRRVILFKYKKLYVSHDNLSFYFSLKRVPSLNRRQSRFHLLYGI